MFRKKYGDKYNENRHKSASRTQNRTLHSNNNELKSVQHYKSGSRQAFLSTFISLK